MAKPNNKLGLLSLFILASTLICWFGLCASDAAAQKNKVRPKPTLKLKARINYLVNSCADAGVQLSGYSLPSTVEEVRLGSPAYYSGIKTNDIVVKGKVEHDQIKLTFKREGKLYSISLATVNKGLKTEQVATTDGSFNGKSQTGTLHTDDSSKLAARINKMSNQEIAKELKDWQIVVVIDKSQSMSHHATGESMSKWTWCRQNIEGFARIYKSPIDIIAFNDDFSVYKNCNSSAVQSFFIHKNPTGNTNLAKPIQHIFDTYKKQTSRKPLLVAVITDGILSPGPRIENVMVRCINSTPKSSKIRVTFLDVGGSKYGAALLRILDEGLTSHGAKRDVVDTKYFAELRKIGLARALMYAISPEPKVQSKSNLDSELRRPKKR